MNNGEIRSSFPGHVKLECTVPFKFGRYMVGEQDDKFLLTMSVESHIEHFKKERYHRSYGFSGFWKSLWNVHKTRRCGHPTRLGDTLELQPGWVTRSLFGDDLDVDQGKSLNIFLTAGSSAARCSALIELRNCESYIRSHFPGGYRIYLRSPNSCLRCATEEAAMYTPCSFLVL
jgi:hypothetical protein